MGLDLGWGPISNLLSDLLSDRISDLLLGWVPSRICSRICCSIGSQFGCQIGCNDCQAKDKQGSSGDASESKNPLIKGSCHVKQSLCVSLSVNLPAVPIDENSQIWKCMA